MKVSYRRIKGLTPKASQKGWFLRDGSEGRECLWRMETFGSSVHMGSASLDMHPMQGFIFQDTISDTLRNRGRNLHPSVAECLGTSELLIQYIQYDEMFSVH